MIHCFVNIKTGDVFKPESYNKPAKHVRYNLLDDVQRLPQHWYGDVFNDSDLRLCHTHYINHIYSKDFGSVFKTLNL